MRVFWQRILLAFALLAAAEAFVATPMRPVAPRVPAMRAVAAPSMALEPSTIDSASSLLALGIPIPAFTPAKAFISMRPLPEPSLGEKKLENAFASLHVIANY